SPPRVAAARLPADEHHARLSVSLEDLGVADRLRAPSASMVAKPQLAVQLDPLLLGERPLLLLELERDIEQPLLDALGGHGFGKEGEVIAKHEDRAGIDHALPVAHELLEEDR